MTWVDRLMGPARAPRTRIKSQSLAVDVSEALHWFDNIDREELGAVRYSTDIARHTQPNNARAHVAFATASVAAVRAGMSEDLAEDLALAATAAEQALKLEPNDPLIMALAAPALIDSNPPRARALLAAAQKKLGRRIPASFVKVASEGVHKL